MFNLNWLLLGLLGLGLVLLDQLVLKGNERPFPYQDVPHSQTSTLRELVYIAKTLANDLDPVLLPENSTESHLAFYDALITNLETRRDISYLVLEVSAISEALQNLNMNHVLRSSGAFSGLSDLFFNWPMTPAEERLYGEYNLEQRSQALHQHFHQALENLDANPWDRGYRRKLVPSLKSSSWWGTSPAPLNLTTAQEADAAFYTQHLIDRRDHALSYLRRNPPTPWTWIPHGCAALKHTSKADKRSRNLHGRSDWTPVYTSWEGNQVPRNWTNPDLSAEEAEAVRERAKEADARDLAYLGRRLDFGEETRAAAEAKANQLSIEA